ncbi:MAG: oligosaccharide flippase family protein [Chitinivibrionales bacterium]|nr:oligosaccharide flippase family protein [Chitinivibrionales bacterium]
MPESPVNPSLLRRRASVSSMMVFISKVVRFGFVFIVNIILMNFLDPADFGLMRYVTIIVGFAHLINEMGLTAAIVQKETLAEHEIASCFYVNALFSITLYGALFLLAPFAAGYFESDELTALIRCGALILPLGGLCAIHRALLQRRMHFGLLAGVEIFSSLASSALSIALAILGHGAWALVYGSVSFGLMSMLALVISVRFTLHRHLNFGAARGLFFFGGALVLQRVMDFASANFDNLAVGKVFGEKALGAYAIAYDIITLPQIALSAVIGNVAIATFSRLQNDDARLRNGFVDLTKISTLIAMPYLLIAGLLSENVMHIVCFIKQSDKWLPAAEPLGLLMLMGIFYSFSGYPGAVWIAKRKLRICLGWALVMLISVIASVIIGARWGIAGVCAALVIRAVVFYPAMLMINYRVFGLGPAAFLMALLPSSLCGCGMAGGILAWKLATRNIFPVDSIPGFVLASIIGVTIYVGMLFIFFSSDMSRLKIFLRQAVRSDHT